MRENAAAMDKLIAANRTTPPQNMTAVEDLKMYQKFAQAHVDGLKNLISSFDKLYAAMPDAQTWCSALPGREPATPHV